MFITIGLAILCVIGDHTNGQPVPTILLRFSAAWGAPDYDVTNSDGTLSDIQSVKVTGSFPANLTCDTTYATSLVVPLNVIINSTSITTTITVIQVWFAGNKGYFSYGTIDNGVCGGGGYVSVALFNRPCEPCCQCGYCEDTQSSSTSLFVIFGGVNPVTGVNCPRWTALKGITYLAYEDQGPDGVSNSGDELGLTRSNCRYDDPNAGCGGYPIFGKK